MIKEIKHPDFIAKYSTLDDSVVPSIGIGRTSVIMNYIISPYDNIYNTILIYWNDLNLKMLKKADEKIAIVYI